MQIKESNTTLIELIRLKKEISKHQESEKRNDLLQAINKKIELIEKQEIVTK
jgi:hypothetical protein